MARALVGAAHDPAERKAERAAGQRARSEASAETAYVAPGSVERAVAGVGEPLEPGVRKDMSRRLGYDFSQVRIHADTDAARSAEDISAAAYTVGNDIAFAPGRYEPTTQEGSQLLAHELAHVAQADNATVRPYRNKGTFNHNSRKGKLTETPFNPKTDVEKLPWIEKVTVAFSGTNSDSDGNTYWVGTATAVYYANAAKLGSLTFSISGGSKTVGTTDAGNYVVQRIEGEGYNSGKHSGTAGVDFDPADREGPNNRYTKEDPISHERNSNMSYAVFYNGGEALHAGPLDLSSHGCVHVDWTSLDTIQQLNYHSVIGLTKVKVSYPKKP